jgi:lysocardiolipin and lysophospholipid acyltransferase
MWCLMYYLGPNPVHRHVYITLKKSLKWVPFLGWVRHTPGPRCFNSHMTQGMQLFNFIFLARSWASDKHSLASSLAQLGKDVEREDNPLCFILYPEGTLVSKLTRPISKKYADKMGIVSHAHHLRISK